MLRNYFRAALRSITRNKLYSALNILGLAVGMAIALVIGLWAYYQYRYDRFLPGYEHCYQVRYKIDIGGDIQTIGATALPLAETLKREIPEISSAVHTDIPTSHGLVSGKSRLYLPGLSAGSAFLQVFQYKLLAGDPLTVLKDRYSIVVTASTARSLFGTTQDVLGRLVRIDNEHDLTVTGVLADLPENATLQFRYLLPLSYKIDETKGHWGYNAFQTFVALRDGKRYEDIAPRLKDMLRRYSPDEYSAVKAEPFLQPMRDWHLYTEFRNGIAVGGMIDYVRLFIIIGVLVLAIACINFMNLCIARGERRAKEVGVRKAIGGRRIHLVIQFLTESVIMAFIAFFAALVLVQLALPWFSELTGCPLALPYGHPAFWLGMTGYVLFTGLLAGMRPAFYLSGFKPTKVLKGLTDSWKGASFPAKLLVIAQFTCSIALISSTIVVYQQISHARCRSMGYTTINFSWGVDEWPGKQPNDHLVMATIAVDETYFQTLGMQLVSGRRFVSGDSNSVVLHPQGAGRVGDTDMGPAVERLCVDVPGDQCRFVESGAIFSMSLNAFSNFSTFGRITR